MNMQGVLPRSVIEVSAQRKASRGKASKVSAQRKTSRSKAK